MSVDGMHSYGVAFVGVGLGKLRALLGVGSFDDAVRIDDCVSQQHRLVINTVYKC